MAGLSNISLWKTKFRGHFHKTSRGTLVISNEDNSYPPEVCVSPFFTRWSFSGMLKGSGLHTVFEHHEAMKEVSLKAFLHEFRIRFPVGIDTASNSDRIPRTMDHYNMQGTPTWLIFDRQGKLVINAFGKVEDVSLASILTQLALSVQPSSSGVLKSDHHT